ncbi:uncharacterized protein ASCRUDRAFT_72689 [Ascoidea rubescens DSM 1968]|uniref:Uncharacterized protein n=1 Tax=Ascoidea rubescens DSM 1968 TaxID=1344418 RepID=A0A1D2V9D5_9ASCO|nr:hypothetical protein ASCRUDRAFT_72689 [Ascoidea rubescens DSM 1968]ODV58272.1 hypothetical protein ASCRUDRAFT_72689 [Ascoidea rubescens DSM 1968]
MEKTGKIADGGGSCGGRETLSLLLRPVSARCVRECRLHNRQGRRKGRPGTRAERATAPVVVVVAVRCLFLVTGCRAGAAAEKDPQGGAASPQRRSAAKANQSAPKVFYAAFCFYMDASTFECILQEPVAGATVRGQDWEMND